MNLLLLAQVSEATASDSDLFSNLAPPLQIALLLGALSFATAMLVSVTAFTRIIIVLSFVRRALSTQEIPPNPVMMGLAMFLTLFVMGPTLESINDKAVQPLMEASQQVEEGETPKFTFEDAWQITVVELKKFMIGNTRTDDF